ncbi:MAG: MBL fold metallo-hydrolase [Clostridia bacterium]
MILKRLKLNTPLGEPTNCYIIADENKKEAMVIDPGGEVDKIVDMLNTLAVNLKYIYLTHCHGDHIAGIPELKRRCGGKVLIHRDDAEGLVNKDISLINYIGVEEERLLAADARVDDGDTIHVGDIKLKVIHTPGHTKGGSSLYSEEYKMLFSGDTLFHGTWGRTDLPTSSFEDIIKSISYKLLVLPEDTIVYPGHGKSTMISEEEPIYYDLKPRED